MVWVLGAPSPHTGYGALYSQFSHQLYISCFIYFHFLVPIILSLRSALFGKF